MRKEKENEKEKEKKEEKEKEEKEEGEKIEKAILKFFLYVHRPLRMHSLARFRHRTGLGNNITPIKGELGKNTTPTNREPSKPNAIPGSPSEPPVKMTMP